MPSPSQYFPHLRRLACAFAALALVAAFTGCASTMMVVPPELDPAPVWMVQGSNPRLWNRPISFGPYSTYRLKDRGTLAVARGDEDFGAGFAWRPYGFGLAGPEGELSAACHVFRLEAAVRGVTIDLSGTAMPALLCAFSDEAGREVGRLRLRMRRGHRFVGTLTADGAATPIEVTSVHRLQGTRLALDTPAGYDLIRGDRAVAAVETINRGRVRLDPQLDPALRAPLAATATALLLFKPELD